METKSTDRTEWKCLSLSSTSRLLVHYYEMMNSQLFFKSLSVFGAMLSALYVEILHSGLSD